MPTKTESIIPTKIAEGTVKNEVAFSEKAAEIESGQLPTKTDSLKPAEFTAVTIERDIVVSETANDLGGKFEDLTVSFRVGDKTYPGILIPEKNTDLGENRYRIAVKIPNSATYHTVVQTIVIDSPSGKLILRKVRTRQCRFPTVNRAIVTSLPIAIAPKPASYDYFAIGKRQCRFLRCFTVNRQQSTPNRQLTKTEI